MKLFDTLEERATDAAMQAADWMAARLPSRGKRPPQSKPLQIIAHRGAWKDRGVIENTIEAFSRARDAGVWGIEFDVRFTKDEVPVVHHDPTLIRTFGRPLLVSGMTLRTLRHEAPVIPTLAEVINEFQDSLHLMIELKGQRAEWTDLRLQQVVEQVAALEPEKQYHFLALDFDLLEALHQRVGVSKKTLVSIATMNAKYASERTLQAKYKAFTAHWMLMTPKMIDEHHRAGQLCGIGFASSKSVLHREWARGVDWAFTNHAHLAPRWLAEIAK